MQIIRRSPITGQINVREIPVTHAQLVSWQNGELIQHAMPNISADDREFILNGFLSSEFDELHDGEE